MNKTLYVLLLILFASCTSEVLETGFDSHTCQFHFMGSIGNYEDEPATRAAVNVTEGAVMYLNFPKNVKGKATYENGSWTLSYNGTIEGGDCSAYCFMDVASETSTVVTLDEGEPVYGTTEGICSIAKNGDITVSAQLKPLTPRVRFKGDANSSVSTHVSYEHYHSFNITTGEFQSESQNISTIKLGSNGYSEYYYYTSMASEMAIVYGGESYSASIPFPSVPKSVCLNLPTKSNLNGWTKEKDSPETHEYVDLGLPSGVKWATCNVGASSPEDYGGYYAWGETETKSSYDWKSYKWCKGSSSSMTKYCTSSSYGTVDNKTVLEPEDDVAHVKWGGSWRMPTDAEIDELIEKCTWIWTTQSGTRGYKVTSKSNGNYIFLPAAGFYIGSYLYYDDESGRCWSGSLDESRPYDAWDLDLGSGELYWDYVERYHGQSIRPVWSESVKVTGITFDKSSLPLSVGDTYTLAATVSPSNATNKSLTWESSNKSVATVDSSGKIAAIKAGTATITATANDGSGVMATCSVTITSNQGDNVHEYVDLGLSVKWATCNVGASSPEDYGDYYAWGETETKDYYDWSTYKWCKGSSTTMTKYCTRSSYGTVDNKTVLDPEDDGAHVKWGGSWRMPTDAELTELREKCTWTWTTQNGVYGRNVTSKSNGNSIFLPAAGYREDSWFFGPGTGGDYWSASLIESDQNGAWGVYFSPGNVSRSGFVDGRYVGQSIRPVWSESVKVTGITFDKSSLPLSVGDTYTLTTTVSPSNATDKSLTWSSSDTSVATVSSSGKVSATKAGTATITATANDGSGVKATCSVTVTSNQGDYNGHEYVDLGLSVKWATCNVGASSPEDYGDYYAWGETETKSTYDWSTYKWCKGSYNTMTKYCTDSYYGTVDNKTVLDPEDDVAHVKWGGSWRMPTVADQDELREKCTWTWTTQNGKKGYKVTSKSNGKSIFLPAAGYRLNSSLNNAGTSGYYWSASLDESSPYYAWYVDFGSSNVSRYDFYRCYGRSVRPVCP